MNKRRITDQQQARLNRTKQRLVQKTQQKLNTVDAENQVNDKQQTGLLIAHYGRVVEVEAVDGRIYRCHVRQHLGSIVPGDKVIWQPETVATGVVVAVMPRQSLLSRCVSATKIKPIAANIDQVLLVLAPYPKPAASLIDSYLVALEALGLATVIVCNKKDLLAVKPETAVLLEQLAVYRQIGYSVLLVSAEQGLGIEELREVLAQRTSVFVGQSGVGKSSLIAQLVADTTVPVAHHVDGATHALHTTTTARLYHLVSGGALIDSPGVRDFVLWDMPAEQIAKNFVEFRPYLGQCRFRDCTHQEPTGCALAAAAANGMIADIRLASYRRLTNPL